MVSLYMRRRQSTSELGRNLILPLLPLFVCSLEGGTIAIIHPCANITGRWTLSSSHGRHTLPVTLFRLHHPLYPGMKSSSFLAKGINLPRRLALLCVLALTTLCLFEPNFPNIISRGLSGSNTVVKSLMQYPSLSSLPLRKYTGFPERTLYGQPCHPDL